MHAAGSTGGNIASATVPQQQNCCDCGLFALAFAERLASVCASGWHSNQGVDGMLEALSLQQAVEHAVSGATQAFVSGMRSTIRELIRERSQIR